MGQIAMKVLRVGGADETVSIRGVTSFAFGNSMSFCNPSCNPTRVSCVAALGWSVAGETVFCCGELMLFVGNCGWWLRSATLRLDIPRLGDCASTNGMAQTARSESRIGALLRRCALMERLICFFIVVQLWLEGRQRRTAAHCRSLYLICSFHCKRNSYYFFGC